MFADRVEKPEEASAPCESNVTRSEDDKLRTA
jgi:hypothetical protein